VNGTGRASFVRAAATTLYATELLRPLSLAASWTTGPSFQILSYHRVNDDNDPFFPAVPTEAFAGHMAWLARAWHVWPLEELVWAASAGRLPRRAVALTFDDGYRDNLTHAAPVLARHGLPATIFLATGFIGTTAVPWFDRVAQALKATTRGAFEAPWGERVQVRTTTERLIALDRALAYLKTLAHDDLERRLAAILDQLAVTDDTFFSNVMLTWHDVRALRGFGFSLGAHTVTHPLLSRVSYERAEMEILSSRTAIESACGERPRTFAYPNGRPEDYTPAIQDLVRRAGFTCAVTTRFGLNTSATSPYELRRGGPWERDLPTFGLKLAFQRAIAPR